MKLRKFEFKRTDIIDEDRDNEGKRIEVKRGFLDYRQTAKDVINHAGSPQNPGTSTEAVVKSVMIYGKIHDAFMKGEDHVYLDAESHQFFVQKLNTFTWGISHPRVAEFIEYVRGLPEEEVTVSAKTEPIANAPQDPPPGKAAKKKTS